MKHSFQLLHNNKYRTAKPEEREMNEEIPTIAVAHGPKQSRWQDRKGNPTTASGLTELRVIGLRHGRQRQLQLCIKYQSAGITKGDSPVSFLQT